jgi:hypothetical protein
MEWDAALRLLSALTAHGVEYILVGGAALGMHGLVRATEDVDIFVRPAEENVARLRRALESLYQDPCISEIQASDLAGEYPAIRYYPPTGELFVDILSRLGEFASFDDLRWEWKDVEGVRVPVATPQTLYWLKRGTVRPQDRLDAEALRERFGLPDEAGPGKAK